MGVIQYLKYDVHTDTMTQKHYEDVGPALQACKELRNEGDGYSPSRDLRRVAHVPDIVLIQWMQKGINPYRREDWPKVAAMLDSPDYAYLRTSTGKIAKKPHREYLSAAPR